MQDIREFGIKAPNVSITLGELMVSPMPKLQHLVRIIVFPWKINCELFIFAYFKSLPEYPLSHPILCLIQNDI